jgi:hypothetical protein
MAAAAATIMRALSVRCVQTAALRDGHIRRLPSVIRTQVRRAQTACV